MSNNKLQRINQLEEENNTLTLESMEITNEIDEHKSEIKKYESEIEKLQNRIHNLSLRNEDIDKEKEEKKQAIRDLSRERYSNKKLRQKLYKYADNSKEKPETALKVKKYLSSDAKDIPDDILEAFVIIENDKNETESNQKSKKELVLDWTKKIGDNLSDLFMRFGDEEEDEVSNDN